MEHKQQKWKTFFLQLWGSKWILSSWFKYLDNLSIFFVQSGETDANKQHVLQGQTNYPLNQTGKDQVITFFWTKM